MKVCVNSYNRIFTHTTPNQPSQSRDALLDDFEGNSLAAFHSQFIVSNWAAQIPKEEVAFICFGSWRRKDLWENYSSFWGGWWDGTKRRTETSYMIEESRIEWIFLQNWDDNLKWHWRRILTYKSIQVKLLQHKEELTLRISIFHASIPCLRFMLFRL